MLIKRCVLISILTLAGLQVYSYAGDLGNKKGLLYSFPQKITALYGGYSLDEDSIDKVVSMYIEPAYKSGFNTIEFKICSRKMDLSDPNQFRRLKELAEAVNERGMSLQCYTYARRIEDMEWAAFITEQGQHVKGFGKYALIHWAVFSDMFDDAFQLARVSNSLGIKAVKIDLENQHNSGISYDDTAWKMFAKTCGAAEDMSLSERLEFLKIKQMKEVYERWFFEQLGEVVKKYEQEMHSINPSLYLGMMPAHGGRFYEAFMRNMSTARMPAIMDSWIMYNVNGFTEDVIKEQKRVKELNPANIFIPWFRLNNYYPEDISVQAYHTAIGTDGYSGWTLSMFNEDQESLSTEHILPSSHKVKEYWDSFKKANDAIKADLIEGKKDANRIPYKPAKVLSPPFTGLDSIVLPLFKPLGDGRGESQRFTLRSQQQIHIFAIGGEKIDVDIRHLGRGIGIHYMVTDHERNVLREETVVPRSKESFSVTAPRTGSYYLFLTGGEGQAWYGVRIHNKHHGLLLPAYIFFASDISEMDYWVARRNLQGPAKVVIKGQRGQIVAAQLNNGEIMNGAEKDIVFDLPEGKKIHNLKLLRPKVTGNLYVQDYIISTEGEVEPYLYDSKDCCVGNEK